MKSKKENYDPVDFLLEIKIRWLWLILLIGAGVIYLMTYTQQIAIDNYEKSIYDVSAPAEGADVPIMFLGIVWVALFLLTVIRIVLHLAGKLLDNKR